jgi:hypothetical protein
MAPWLMRSARVRTLKASASATPTANTAVTAPRRKLVNAHCPKRAQGNSVVSPAKARNKISTGNTKPNSTGKLHKPQANTRRVPCSTTGCASAEPWRAPRPWLNRMRFWARCSSCSNTTTTASSTVANCAAAMRLSMDSQAL